MIVNTKCSEACEHATSCYGPNPLKRPLLKLSCQCNGVKTSSEHSLLLLIAQQLVCVVASCLFEQKLWLDSHDLSLPVLDSTDLTPVLPSMSPCLTLPPCLRSSVRVAILCVNLYMPLLGFLGLKALHNLSFLSLHPSHLSQVLGSTSYVIVRTAAFSADHTLPNSL